ncbi:MAG: FprA family A-type flavoprotein [Christensenellales bacterium]|jgi:flavorubredoxin
MAKHSAVKMKDGFYYVGVQDPGLRTFDVVMHTEYGTSYNSYLVRGEKVALVEAVKDGFQGEHLEKIRSVVQPEKIDYIVLNHTEPDHSGSVADLLEHCPYAKVVCSKVAAGLLEEICNREIDFIIAKDGDSIDLGGKTLQFFSVPFLHWPDTMFTYVPEDQMLLSGDVFGCHFSSRQLFDDEVDSPFEDAQQYYFDVIMSPFKSYVLDAVEKVWQLKVDMIAPAHGPVLRSGVRDIVDLYEGWAAVVREINDPKRAFVGYVSCYGYTKELAEEIAKGCRAENLEVDLVDLSETDLYEALALLMQADVVAIGSPTVNRDVLPPVWDVLLGLSPYTCKGKKALSFGSFGWSGEAVRYVERRMKDCAMQTMPALSVKLKPREQDKDAGFEAGKALGRAVE